MRGLVLIIGLLGGLGLTLPYPYVGVLLWSWFALQQPHQDAYGFVLSIPLNLIIALVTLAAWLLSSERKRPPFEPIFWMMAAFLVWMTFNSFFAFDPAWSWPYWDRTWKTFFLGFVISAMATSRNRIYALVWIMVISLFYYGVKGGLFTIITGGHFHVIGPQATAIGDNNSLAAALLMVLPFANYLRGQVADKRIAVLLTAGMALTIISVVGSYSRGAVVGLGALALFALLRARNRFVYLGFAAVIFLFVLQFMPEGFFQRVATITTATQDTSFAARLQSWQVSFSYALDHFPFGAGFYAIQLGTLYNHYFPGQVPHAVHSIYFQVLGEQGFVGAIIYLCILAAAFVRCSVIVSRTRRMPEQRWANELAVAIQASLFVFAVSGAALPIAYYDLFIMETMLLLPLTEIVLHKQNRKFQPSAASAIGRNDDFGRDTWKSGVRPKVVPSSASPSNTNAPVDRGGG
jgi:probable O-glycosylation ligase (exosortase A-associated)